MGAIWKKVTYALAALALAVPCMMAGEVDAYVTDTHPILVDYALEVLWSDGWEYLVDYLVESESLGRIKSGLVDCDRLDLALNHYYNPVTDAGMSGGTPATEIAQTFFSQAQQLYANGDISTAWYYFGWSLHCVQDLTVPFHSNLDPLNGHSEYEAYAHDYRHYLPLPSTGIYGVSFNASQWAVNASERSYAYYDDISGGNATEEHFDTVLTLLFPQAVALTAGYIKFFSDVVGVGEFNLYELKEGIDWVKVGWDETTADGFVAYELWLSTDDDDIYDGDPYDVITDRTMTEKTLTDLELGTDYYVQVRMVSNATTAESNMIEVSPGWPLAFFAVPCATGFACVLLFLSKKHRRPAKSRR